MSPDIDIMSPHVVATRPAVLRVLRVFILIGWVLSQASESGGGDGLEWTICRAKSGQTAAASRISPPSQWKGVAYNELCFLKRRAAIPGTALLQHWLADFANNASSHNFDPTKDFPPIEIRNRYSDISSETDQYLCVMVHHLDRPSNVDEKRASDLARCQLPAGGIPRRAKSAHFGPRCWRNVSPTALRARGVESKRFKD